MPLQYALFENNLTSDPDDYSAVIQSAVGKSQEEIIDLMISRGSTVTKAEALSVMEEYALAIEQILKEGGSIVTPLFNLAPSISGVFSGQNDSFTPSRHQVRVRILPGTRLRKMEPLITTQKVTADKPMPVLQEYKDIASNTRNETLTPGGVGQLRGSRLKFEETDVQQGIFLIASNGTATRVATLVRHKPAELIFVVPTGLVAGQYQLEVRTIFRDTTELRKGVLPDALTVL